MDCKGCLEELTAYQDDELDAATAGEVKSHLGLCVSCAAELSSLQETSGFMEDNARNLTPSPLLWNRIKAEISLNPQPSSFSLLSPRNRWRFALASLTLAAGIFLGYLQYAQVQQRNLENYMEQYVRAREARKHMLPTVRSQSTKAYARSPYENNPFVDVKVTLVGNPFQSEDR
jgi:anti-sigma factor RsiW